ncbi:MAG: hypothetical protein BGO39_15585 [Chloroflexi bacterium 54-19]|nr:MAG: hypothetical protein BGO39_15585 [Chloroflexi bacterium 54-19]
MFIAILLGGPGFFVFSFNLTEAAAPVWSPPAILLPYVGGMPSLCVNPLDSTMSYLVGSGGYGETTGSEGNNWLNGTFTKLSDLPGTGSCAFNEFGTLHAVWSLRGDSGTFNIYYNSVQKGSGNVPLYRNLTKEIYGQDKYTLDAHIAVSIQQKKVFIIYRERSDNGDPLMFIESDTQGDTWSKPLNLGTLSGYRPAEPELIVDKAGLPHVFYGVFREGGPSVIYHRMRLANGSWVAPENITGNDLSRPIWTQAELDPVSGDIYVSWVEGQTGISHWNATTGKWTTTPNISNSGGRAFFPTIAVNSQTGVIWDIWADGPNIWSRQSLDHGQTWQGKELVVNEDAAKIGRMYGLKARSTRGIIYLLISADQLDPLYYVGSTLSLMTFDQSISTPGITPTTSPKATGTPGGTTTPVIQPTLSPEPLTPGPTATPEITQSAPTITPQPTATLLPTVTPQPTATPIPTATPQPTATPIVFPTAIPTSTAQSTITPTSIPTATPKPVAPTSTSIPLPVPAQVPGQSQNQPSQSGQAQTPTPTQPPATLPATATVPPEVLEATAMAEAQRIAAATPQSLVVPLAPPGSGGKGPLLVLPSSTPIPTATVPATATPQPTATTNPSQLTATVRSEMTVAAQNTKTASNMPSQQTIVKEAGLTQNVPPATGPLWLLPLGLAVAGKGLLNLLAFRLRP